MGGHDTRFPRLIAHGSRRAALRAGAGGLAAVLGAADLRRAVAQGATPAADQPVEYLFIQSFASGTLTPKEVSDSYELTLLGGTGQTIYFADRPNREVGAAPTAEVIAAIGFDPTNPPNAGLVAETDGGEWIIILELMNLTLDDVTGTLTYEVRIVTDYEGEGLQSLAAKASGATLPGRFGPASLFIDSHTVVPPHGY
jgi:hypothetical protein